MTETIETTEKSLSIPAVIAGSAIVIATATTLRSKLVRSKLSDALFGKKEDDTFTVPKD